MSRRNPLVGVYKSALQKFIRRGEVDKAVAIAKELIEFGESEQLIRRLTVICAEDVGGRYLPEVGVMASTFMVGEGQTAFLEGDPRPVLDIVGGLALAGKDKEAYWLAANAWAGRRPMPADTQWSLELRKALVETRDPIAACAVLFGANESKVKLFGPAGLTREFESPELPLPKAAREIVQWGLWRASFGGIGMYECLAAAVIGAIDASPMRARLPEVDWTDMLPFKVDWYAYDVHTSLGRMAVNTKAKQIGMNREMLGELQFAFESALVSPEMPARWKKRAMTLDAEQYGWLTPDRGVELWAMVRDDMRSLIEWLLDRGVR